jgi:outer membrane immunogenic protein
MRTRDLRGTAVSGAAAVLPTLGVAAMFALIATGGAAAGDWSGAYGGVHAGYAWGQASVTDTNGGVPPGPFPYSVSGAFGGATLGSNLQNGNFVAGIEGDIGFMNLMGAGIVPSSNPAYHQDITLKGGLYGDITGRLGFGAGQTLFYGKGGFAFYSGQANQVTTKPGYTPTGTGTFTGWTLGGGVEHQVTPTMTVKVEYLHFDFGTQGGYQTNIGDTSSPANFQFMNETSLKADSVKIGLNWHFGAP